MIRRRHPMAMVRSDAGFTLVETLAALIVFTLITLGVLPLLASSLRGATVSRSYTIGRNLAQQAMERVRGLPYHVAFNTQASKVDVLDLYYPTSETDGVAETICDSTTTANPACLRNLATDYSVTFRAEFVNPGDPTDVLVSPTDYSGYAWNSATDAPPSQLLRMTITARWSVGGTARNYALQSLISDRKFGDLKFGGTSTIDHLVRVTGSFFEGGARADLIARIGTANSTIESKLQSSAEQDLLAAGLTLLDEAGVELDSATGAETTLRVPPQANETGTPATPGSSGDVLHPNPGGRTIAAIGPSFVEDARAGVAAELPFSGGTFHFGTNNTGALDFWVAEQTALTGSPLALEGTGHFLEIVESDSSAGVFGETTAQSTSLGSGSPETSTTAETSVNQIRLFPVQASRIPAPQRDLYGGAVVVVRDFEASTTCESTGTASTAEAVVTWSATLTYWSDPDNDASGDGGYVDRLLTGALGTDPLEAIQTANPLVWEAPTGDPTQKDVYLFEVPNADPTLARVGYLHSWASQADISTTGTDEDTSGDETSAKIPGAINITTASPDPLASTGLSIDIGSLSCRAVEFRA